MKKSLVCIMVVIMIATMFSSVGAWDPSEKLKATEDHDLDIDGFNDHYATSELTNWSSYSEADEEWVDVNRNEIRSLDIESKVDSIQARAEANSVSTTAELDDGDSYTDNLRDDRLNTVPSDTELDLELSETEDLGEENISIDWMDDVDEDSNISYEGYNGESSLTSNEITDTAIEINDWHDLYDVRNDLSSDYKLVSNLSDSTAGYSDYNTGDGWNPIGDENNEFKGEFDGNKKTISDLRIDRSTQYVGLFGYTDVDSEISSLYLENVDIKNTEDNTGALVGFCKGTILSSYSNGSVDGGSGDRVGGLVGHLTSGNEMWTSYSDADVKGNNNVGGLIGNVFKTDVVKCYSRGDVEASNIHAGGLFGRGVDVAFYDGYATGEVSGEYAGGLLGYDDDYGDDSSCLIKDSMALDTSSSKLVGRNGGNTGRLGRVTHAPKDDMRDIRLYKRMDDFKDYDNMDSNWDISRTDYDKRWFIDDGKDYPVLTYTEEFYQLTINIEGSGSELNYGEGTHDLPSGNYVELEAEPDGIGEFVNWTGYVDSDNESVGFIMPESDINMNATFTDTEYIEATEDDNYWQSKWFNSSDLREVTNMDTEGRNYTVYYRENTSDDFSVLDVGSRFNNLQLKVELDYEGDYMVRLDLEMDLMSKVDFEIMDEMYTDWEKGDSGTFNYDGIEELDIQSHSDHAVFNLDYTMSNYPLLENEDVPRLSLEFRLLNDSSVLEDKSIKMGYGDEETIEFDESDWNKTDSVGMYLDTEGLIDSQTSLELTSNTTINWVYYGAHESASKLFDMFSSLTFWALMICVFVGVGIALSTHNPQAGVGGYIMLTILFGIWGWVHWLIPFISILAFGMVFTLQNRNNIGGTMNNWR